MKLLIFTIFAVNILTANSIVIYNNNRAFVNETFDLNISKPTTKLIINNLTN